MADETLTREGECAELLQQLIRNACVNDGTVGSGGEQRSSDLLRTYLEGSGVEIETYESAPQRSSLVARIEGTDPDAPALLLMGHTDVVPANPEHWRHDPFGGEIIDGEIWGRGAVDMLNLTASMAVATKRLARSGFAPRGTLIYLAVADEEAHSTYGAGHLIAHERDAVMADYVITESGGIPLPSPSGLKLPVIVGEKGVFNMRINVRGTAGHGSQPYRTDNALVTAAEEVRRIDAFEPATKIHEIWQRFIGSMGYPEEITRPLLSVDGLDEILGPGIPWGSSLLISGVAGTGKTMLSLEFVYRGALAGERGVLFSFEESEQRLRAVLFALVVCVLGFAHATNVVCVLAALL